MPRTPLLRPGLDHARRPSTMFPLLALLSFHRSPVTRKKGKNGFSKEKIVCEEKGFGVSFFTRRHQSMDSPGDLFWIKHIRRLFGTICQVLRLSRGMSQQWPRGRTCCAGRTAAAKRLRLRDESPGWGMKILNTRGLASL